jgi:5-methylcytosine-specific restriction endonuclease McrA
MNLRETIKQFKKFMLHKKQYDKWMSQYSNESSSSKGFTKELKKKIKDRDNWTCQECGILGRMLRQLHSYLTIHHINFNHNDCRPDNLITLCPLCHAKTNFVQSSWIKYYLEKTGQADDNKVKGKN